MQHDHILIKLILYKPMLHMRQGHFWPQGHNLDRIGRGPLGDATYQYQGSMPCGFRQEDFFMVSLYKPMHNM